MLLSTESDGTSARRRHRTKKPGHNYRAFDQGGGDKFPEEL
ncbi:MAG TPA: hypothetical protein VE956_23330 [Nodularia sp. (in: cyanobacteria)]|nr:hypothetical protein [Nodularia sp. (in: cyanobacteria)]